MKHTHKTYSFDVILGERKLLSFAGGETPKPESESGKTKVDASAPGDAKTNEEMDREAQGRNERREEDMKEEDEERAEELPKIERDMENSDAGNDEENSADENGEDQEMTKEEVDQYYGEAVDSVRPPMQEVLAHSIQPLDDQDKSSLLKHTMIAEEEISGAVGTMPQMSPKELGNKLSMTLRVNVFADREMLQKTLASFDPALRELADNADIRIKERMGDALPIATAAKGKMNDAARAYAEANPEIAKQITLGFTKELNALAAIAKMPRFREFSMQLRNARSVQEANGLTTETPSESDPKKKEKAIEQKTKKLQGKMRVADEDVSLKGSAGGKGEIPVFKVSFDKMDGAVKDVTMAEAKKQFESGEIKADDDSLTLDGKDAIEFANFLGRMDRTDWRKVAEKSKEEENEKK